MFLAKPSERTETCFGKHTQLHKFIKSFQRLLCLRPKRGKKYWRSERGRRLLSAFTHGSGWTAAKLAYFKPVWPTIPDLPVVSNMQDSSNKPWKAPLQKPDGLVSNKGIRSKALDMHSLLVNKTMSPLASKSTWFASCFPLNTCYSYE